MSRGLRTGMPLLLERAVKSAQHRLGVWMYTRRRVPYSYGYGAYRDDFIAGVIGDEMMLEHFRRREQLPAGYGQGLDERCVEYPWCLASIPSEARRVLDAGSVLNNTHLVGSRALTDLALHIITLAPEGQAFWRRGISYIYGDLRELPMRDAYYDAVVCLSTLEHVGMDNRPYTQGKSEGSGDAEGKGESESDNRPSDFIIALQELHRVLRPGGVLLLSVPYGMYENRHRLQQFDRTMLKQAIEVFPGGTVETIFFLLRSTGWQLAAQDECDGARFGVWGTPDAGKLQGVTPAAQAVACVRLQRTSTDAISNVQD
jgi:SAM-dependent methyltransferase